MQKVSTSSLLLSGDTPHHGGHRPDPEVLRVDAHVLHPYIGPLYSQIALVKIAERAVFARVGLYLEDYHFV
jgi:hypothetical protein